MERWTERLAGCGNPLCKIRLKGRGFSRAEHSFIPVIPRSEGDEESAVQRSSAAC